MTANGFEIKLHPYLIGLAVVLAFAAFQSMAEEATSPQVLPGLVVQASAEETLAPSMASFPKVRRYAKQLIARYDKDGSGYLTADEWGEMERLDLDGDAKLTDSDLIRHIVDYNRSRRLVGTVDTRRLYPGRYASNGNEPATSDPAAGDSKAPGKAPTDPNPDTATLKRYYVPPKHLPSGLPSWFVTRDLNGDGQLSLAEYAPRSGSTAVASFRKLDANGDGLLTPAESLHAPDRKEKDVPASSTDKK